MKTLDKDGDGTISREEFAQAMDEYPTILNCFAGSAIPNLVRVW